MKEKLTLSIEKSIKDKAKHIAGKNGKSVSGLFEDFILDLSTKENWLPPKGSATEKIFRAIPEEKKVSDYDYKSLKKKAIQRKLKKS